MERFSRELKIARKISHRNVCRMFDLSEKGITDLGAMIGTPDYMSPEQVDGIETDRRADLYAVGVILYEMLTGRGSFEGETALAVVLKHKSEAPRDPKEINPQIPYELGRLILKCLEKEAAKRFQSTAELLSELSRVEQGVAAIPGAEFPGKPEVKTTGETSRMKSIAVLPFADLSPQKDQEYFCDGMAEELITSLTQINDLRVVARTSAFSFKGKDVDVREIGKKLNVEAILEGSVRKGENRMRITAQLIVGLGDKDQAFEWFDTAYRQHDSSLIRIAGDETLTGLRGDPRFEELVNKMKIP